MFCQKKRKNNGLFRFSWKGEMLIFVHQIRVEGRNIRNILA